MRRKERQKKDTKFGNFVCTKQKQTKPNSTISESVCLTFTTVNPTKSTPIMIKIGDNTSQDVYKHPKFKLLKNSQYSNEFASTSKYDFLHNTITVYRLCVYQQ